MQFRKMPGHLELREFGHVQYRILDPEVHPNLLDNMQL